jgi:hypothetical protein|tara:strand:+ start:6952 stop:7194 length:243 start_codon:yes stop_codon:yes gene_type:complete
MESKYLTEHYGEPTSHKWVKEIESVGFYSGEIWLTCITVNESTGDCEKENIVFDALDVLKSGLCNKKEIKNSVRKKLAKL